MNIQDSIHIILFVSLTILTGVYAWKQYKTINDLKGKNNDSVD